MQPRRAARLRRPRAAHRRRRTLRRGGHLRRTVQVSTQRTTAHHSAPQQARQHVRSLHPPPTTFTCSATPSHPRPLPTLPPCHSHEMQPGESVKVRMSPNPVPTINSEDGVSAAAAVARGGCCWRCCCCSCCCCRHCCCSLSRLRKTTALSSASLHVRSPHHAAAPFPSPIRPDHGLVWRHPALLPVERAGGAAAHDACAAAGRARACAASEAACPAAELAPARLLPHSRLQGCPLTLAPLAGAPSLAVHSNSLPTLARTNHPPLPPTL